MRYAAFLRAINVGGKNMVPMAKLRDLFETSGFSDVRTYIQTGNVVFSSSERDTDKIERRLKKKLAVELGFDVGVFVKTKRQLEVAVGANPFDPEKHDHEQHTHLMFLSGAPTKSKVDALVAKAGGQGRFAIKGSVLYYAYSREIVGSRRAIPIEKTLGVAGTMRTWKVVNKIIGMLNED